MRGPPMMQPAAAAPCLLLRATWADGVVTGASASDRQPPVAPLLHGLTPAEALARLPLIVDTSVLAHTTAARLACAAATGEAAPDPVAAIATERQLAAEAAQGHLWRLLLDWPPLFGIEPRRNRYTELHRRLARAQEAEAAFALGGDLLDLVVGELLAGLFRHAREPLSLNEFVDRAAGGGNLGSVLASLIGIGAAERCAASGPVPTLPHLGASAWASLFSTRPGGLPSAEFCAAPIYEGEPAETGPLARHLESPLVRMLLAHGHRISARLLAQVIDLADCGTRLRRPLAPEVPALADVSAIGPGLGLATIETARGLLMHGVRIDDGRITDYAICTPSAWNFHPAGSFVREGSDWTAQSQSAAELRLNALILALDPGSSYQLEIVLPGASANPSTEGRS